MFKGSLWFTVSVFIRVFGDNDLNAVQVELMRAATVIGEIKCFKLVYKQRDSQW